MPIDATLIDRPVKAAVRLIALQFLSETETARRAWREGTDPEALHDMRVALRRLRSSLRAYRPYLMESIRRKDRKRLTALARATGESRDREVQLEMLGKLEGTSEAEAPAIAWLVNRLATTRAKADAEVRRIVENAFPKERARLERRLSEYRQQVDAANPDSGEPTLGYAAAGLVTVLAAQLEARLAAVRDLRDQQLAHNARIAGKRLRYVLEPLRPALPIAASIIQRLKGLQDLFGEMHDSDVFQKEVATFLEHPRAMDPDAPPEAGLIALSARFAAERERLFEVVREQWLGQQAFSFFDDTRRAALALRAHSPDSVEIERRFLLRSLPRMGRRVRRLTIEQGWLPGEHLQERLRRVRGPDGVRWYRTVKSGRGTTRIEIEEETTRDTFSRLWRLTAGRRIRKRRYLREDGNLMWEVDQFLDRDLLLAEVELPTSDTTVRIPDWLETHIVREVTGEPAYLNVNLAS